MRTLLLFLILFIPFALRAQFTISGTVMDRKTHEVLAFVNILSEDGKTGTSTDIEGRFTLVCAAPIKTISLSYLGYYPLSYTIDPSLSKQLIYLDKKEIELNDVVVLPGINPAEVIMQKVIDQRKKLDPERSTDFSYRMYNKMYVTLNPDSSLLQHPEKLDTNTKEALAFFDKQHLFLAESVTERVFFLPDKNKESIIASRVSGFENPVFSLLATEFQSFSFYRDFVSLGGVQYECPIAPGGTSRYFFLLEDTLVRDSDTLWVISFRPKKGKNFKGMKGTMTISNTHSAIVNVIAEPAKVDESTGLGIKIQQRYDLVQGKFWFPVQLNTTLFFYGIKVENFNAVGIANGYLRDISFEPKQAPAGPKFVDSEMNPDAGRAADSVWQNARIDSLSAKEIRTYQVIDSIGKAAKLERKINAFTYLLDGQIPIKKISLDLDRVLQYNDYEGFRLGAGFHTNARLSKYFNIGGYAAYGFKDKEVKYGADVNFMLPFRDIDLKISYSHDLIETGGVSYFEKKRWTNTEDLSDLFRNVFDVADQAEVVLGARFLRHFKGFGFMRIQDRNFATGYDVVYRQDGFSEVLIPSLRNTEIGAALRFQYRETFTKTPTKLISKGSPFPIVWIKFTQGLDLANGQTSFTRWDFRIEKTHSIRRIGRLSYRLDAGTTEGSNLPLSMYFNPRGTYRSLKDLAVFSGMGFEVMRTNEFLLDRYAALHFRHDFTSSVFKGKFRPTFAWTTKVLFGTAPSESRYAQASAGYYESGFMINSLIRSGISGIGVGAFYRYGPYQLPKAIDNWAFKLTIGFVLD